MLSTQPRPKAGVWVLKCSLFFCGVTNWYSWDADWSQVGNLETLIGSCALYSDLMLLWSTCFFNGEAGNYGVLACQVGPFHLTLTQINSEMNCIAKNKCPESHKLDTRRRGENLNTTSDTCEEQQHVYFCIFCLWFIQEKCQKIFLPFWNSLIPSNVCVIIGTWLIGHSIIPRLDNYCDINLWNTIKCTFHLAAQMDWLLFNRSSKAFVKNDDLVRCTLWKLYWFITLVIFWKVEWEFSSLKSLKNRLTCYSWINMADYVT